MSRQPQRIVAPARRDRSRKPRLESLERRDLMALFTVSSVADSGPGSLRAAIVASNANTDLGANSINFNIPAAGTQTISLLSPLPTITHSIALDGRTQPGYSNAPLIVLNGTGAGAGANGLTFIAGGNAVRGLALQGFTASTSGSGGEAIVLDGAGGNTIQNCYIGTNGDASAAVPNRVGILIASDGNVIGGNVGSLRNFISGNTGAGAVAGAGVLISGTAKYNVLEGNYIGLNFNGQTAIPNSYGVLFGGGNTGASGLVNRIGGTIFGSGNFISGNTLDGVALNGASGTLVEGNYIGLDAAGNPEGNGGNGVSQLVYTGSTNAITLNNTIGGTSTEAGNLIWFNKKAGVAVANTAGGPLQGVTIQANSFTGNGQLGIDIGANGVTPGYLFVTSSVRDSTGILTLRGVYHGVPNTNYQVDLYGSTSADPSGYGQGDLYLSTVTITTDILGNATFTQPYTGVSQGVYTAVVKDSAGTSSEFSPAFPLNGVPPSADLSLTLTGPTSSVFLGSNVTLTATVSNFGTGTATNVLFDNLLPNGLFFISGTSTSGTVSSSPSGLLHADLGSIAPGASVTVTIIANAMTTGALINAAAGFGTAFDPNYTNNQATQTITILPAVRPTSDLGIGQTSFAPFVGKVVGQNLVYTITVTNYGPNNATGVTVTDFIAAGQQYVDASSSQGSSSFANGILTTNLGSLGVGASATVTILLKLTQAGNATNVANVSGTQLDTNTGNNSSTLVDVITGSAATTPLLVSQTPSPASVTAGQPQTITVTITNPNTVAAPGVVLVDTIPTNTTFVRATASQGSFSLANGIFTANIGTMPAGGSATVVLTLLPGSTTPIVNNVASIASGVPGALFTYSTLVIPTVAPSTGPVLTGITTPSTTAGISRLSIIFSTPLNGVSATRLANYRVYALGASGTTSRQIAVRAVSYNATTRTATITLASALPRSQYLRLIFVGATTTGIKDLAGNRLNGAGTPGTNYNNTFLGTVIPQV